MVFFNNPGLSVKELLVILFSGNNNSHKWLHSAHGSLSHQNVTDTIF